LLLVCKMLMPTPLLVMTLTMLVKCEWGK
jgi:hypothetical protein